MSVMAITPFPVEAIQIDYAPGLDRICIFWANVEPGKGYVTIICYGSAWTAYFGAMGGRTIQEFFADADVDYLVTKMQSPMLKETKRWLAYLSRIVAAVKMSLEVNV